MRCCAQLGAEPRSSARFAALQGVEPWPTFVAEGLRPWWIVGSELSASRRTSCSACSWRRRRLQPVKIDVEGYETMVLGRCGRGGSQRTQLLLIELSPQLSQRGELDFAGWRSTRSRAAGFVPDAWDRVLQCADVQSNSWPCREQVTVGLPAGCRFDQGGVGPGIASAATVPRTPLWRFAGPRFWPTWLGLGLVRVRLAPLTGYRCLLGSALGFFAFLFARPNWRDHHP